MRILVLRGGALGDFIVTLPALQLLRERWPEAEIELIGNARAAELGVVSGMLNRVHSQHEGRWSALYAEAPLPPSLAAWLDDFDLIISYWSDLDGTLRRHLTRSKGTFIAGSPRVTSRPAARTFCAALEPIGLKAAHFQAQLSLPAAVQAEAARRLGGFEAFVAVHSGSGSPTKVWPGERWAHVCSALRQPVLAITGEAETRPVIWPEDLFVQRAHEWPLPVLAAALQRCQRFFGHDSGISHLAAAIGCPCVVLFGPTDPEIWAPVGPDVRVIKRGGALSDISVADVLGAVTTAPRTSA